MKQTSKRDELIQAGREIIVRRGFNATGLNNILAAAGVPKGSFYYYFESKEDFGLAIIEDFAAYSKQQLRRTLGDTQVSPLTRLNNYFAAGIADMQSCQCTKGCLVGNLAQELSAQNELFRDRLNQVLAYWQQQLIQCLESACEAGEINRPENVANLAQFILSGWEGSILQAKVTKSVVPMQNFVSILFGQVLRKSADG